jgi:hypothetical protein
VKVLWLLDRPQLLPVAFAAQNEGREVLVYRHGEDGGEYAGLLLQRGNASKLKGWAAALGRDDLVIVDAARTSYAGLPEDDALLAVTGRNGKTTPQPGLWAPLAGWLERRSGCTVLGCSPGADAVNGDLRAAGELARNMKLDLAQSYLPTSLGTALNFLQTAASKHVLWRLRDVRSSRAIVFQEEEAGQMAELLKDHGEAVQWPAYFEHVTAGAPFFETAILVRGKVTAVFRGVTDGVASLMWPVFRPRALWAHASCVGEGYTGIATARMIATQSRVLADAISFGFDDATWPLWLNASRMPGAFGLFAAKFHSGFGDDEEQFASCWIGHGGRVQLGDGVPKRFLPVGVADGPKGLQPVGSTYACVVEHGEGDGIGERFAAATQRHGTDSREMWEGLCEQKARLKSLI